jgi:hypothetical protein
MTPASPGDRRAAIAACGGHGAVLEEALAYCESPFDTAALGPVTFPLPDEPHLNDWRRYAAAGGDQLWTYLRARLPQLRVPIRKGISTTDAYVRLVRRGEPVDEAALGGTLPPGRPHCGSRFTTTRQEHSRCCWRRTAKTSSGCTARSCAAASRCP